MRNSTVPQTEAKKADLSQGDDTPRAEGCEWTPDSEDTWDTACRKVMTFTDDGPVENGFEFCPFCGRTIIILNEADS